MSQPASAQTEQLVGHVSHYYTHLLVAAVELTGTLRVGDTIHIRGHTSDFTQKVESMQIEHRNVSEAGPGASIGLKVIEHAREGDQVFLVSSSPSAQSV